MAKKKFYAVKKGAVPGIYTSWAETEVQVKGFPGAKFKGFAARDEAEAWLKNDQEKASTRRTTDRAILPAAPPPVVTGNETIIYTDGGAIGNPGPGGYGVVIVESSETRELSSAYRLTTNNRMELMACIAALREVKGTRNIIVLHSDSSYVVNGMSKGWVKNWQRNGWRKSDKQPVLNQDLWEELVQLASSLDITFKWVKGHAGNPLNERCDQLAVQAARGSEFEIDRGYEQK